MACNNPQAMAELSQAARCFDKLYLLQERAIPALVDIIRAPDTNSPVLVEGALDVLAALLRPSTPEQAANVHSAASSHVMTLALHQDDAAILQSCSEYLRCILLASGQSLHSLRFA